MKYVIILFILLSFGCSAQKKQIDQSEIVYDTFLDITFNENSLDMTIDGKNVLDNICKWVNQIGEGETKNYTYHFQVIPSLNEENDFISFKRTKIILDYLKKYTSINQSKFNFNFYEPIHSESIIRFSINE